MEFMTAMHNPKPEFSPAAFWFWYGELDQEQLRRQIDMMAEQGVYNGFMHARAYLKTPYLEDEWWEAVSACVDEGKKVGFFSWLYDEYAWPSGTVGSTFNYGHQKPSRILSEGEQNMSKFLTVKKYASSDEFLKETFSKKPLAAFFKDGENWKLFKDDEKINTEIIAFFRHFSPRFVDYLNENTIRKFIDYTHEEYKKRFAEYFGNVIPGIFFDEIFMICKMPWTDRFPEEFQKRMGYDILPKLYALGIQGGDEERKIRNDYFTVVSELYEETFFKQISEWCKENKLDFTGHIEEFFVQHPGRQGQFFNNLRHLSIPGADCHDYRYRFPRKITYREPKFSVSVARAYGKKRMMSEAMGGAGWGCSLQQFKRGINTLGAMGINMVTLHGFYSECKSQGEQADWPCSFFFQNPYWRYFKLFADYINRICYINTQGTPVVEVGLYYPIEEMQMETVAAAPTDRAIALDNAWNSAMNSLIENQIDVDIIDKPRILDSKIENGCINVGVQSFKILVCPDVMEASEDLKKKLEEFVRCGGTILYYSCGDLCKDGALKTGDLPKAVEEYFQTDIKVLRGEKDNLYVNHRKIEGKDLYFIANGAPRNRSVELLLREKGGVQKLSPENGKLCDIHFEITDNGTKVSLSLLEDEACWLVVDKDCICAKTGEEFVAEELAVAGKWEFLPINSDVVREEQLNITSSETEIPLAMFSSKLHPFGRQIRIQNTKEEKGNCGRHLSLWKAKWITRRLDWTDSSMQKELYFRRKVNLSGNPSEAKICITAVNKWTMWINGMYVAESSVAREPEIVDIYEFLNSGENLIAIKVENETPMEHFNLLSVDSLPPEEMISLLAQAEITVRNEKIVICTDEKWDVNDHFYENWERLSYNYNLHYAHSTSSAFFGDEDKRWSQSWERGSLPLLPWGDLPLFGELVSYPQRVCYSVTLPAGTNKVFYPDVTGSDVSVSIDGMEQLWNNGECLLFPDGKTHQMQIHITVNSQKEGLHSNIKIQLSPFRSALCDWRLHGLSWYAGFARYRNVLNINKKTGCYILKLGKVAFQAEVWVNGNRAGERVWEPYEIDVTDFIKDGENEFVVIASNSAAVERQFMLVDEGMALGWNRYWNDDNIQREGENLLSGLLGPVELFRKEIMEGVKNL